ncbi:Terminase small subunit (gp1) [Escherichia coli]|nr:Terminase small subunit (gp1) [Escherichia coli]
MKVNKKKLAEIFNVDPRTIERWQSQGLSCVSGGSKGVESVFDTAMAIQWYAQRETDIENEKLRKELEDLRAAAESDLQPGTIDYERYRLTKAQADAQELKNAREEGLVLETELFTFILQRVAQEISGILVRVPLTLQRKYRPYSAFAAGLRARIDYEKGWWWSKSNQEVYNILGVEQVDEFILGEQDIWLLTAADYAQLTDAFNVFMLPPGKRPKPKSSEG